MWKSKLYIWFLSYTYTYDLLFFAITIFFHMTPHFIYDFFLHQFQQYFIYSIFTHHNKFIFYFYFHISFNNILFTPFPHITINSFLFFTSVLTIFYHIIIKSFFIFHSSFIINLFLFATFEVTIKLFHISFLIIIHISYA